jgi:glycosyltransferase involved in cell wall biosynthesis
MRIAFLSKRHYMGKDVILDRYARLYEVPFQLAKRGHEIRGFCLDYHLQSAGAWTQEIGTSSLSWESYSLDGLRIPAMINYPYHLLRQLRDFDPHLLIGASDIPHVALAAWLARKLHLPYVTDLYDNFEGFGQAKIPGFISALRRSVRSAALVITTSEPLRRMIMDSYGVRGNVIAMPSSVDKTIFSPMETARARGQLGLPIDAKLIGTAGGLYREKGIEPLYEAWKRIAAARPDTHLVLAGPLEKRCPPPSGLRVHYLGHLAHTQIATLFNALDVGVISVLDTPFGRYCFPQKAYEMLACNLSVAAANVGAMGDLFADTPEVLFKPGDAEELASVVCKQLDNPSKATVPIADWEQLITTVEPQLRQLAKA